jgi:hypothetical protein
MTWVFIDVLKLRRQWRFRRAQNIIGGIKSTSSTAATRIQPDLPAGVVYPTRLMGARILISGSVIEWRPGSAQPACRSLFYVAFRQKFLRALVDESLFPKPLESTGRTSRGDKWSLDQVNAWRQESGILDAIVGRQGPDRSSVIFTAGGLGSRGWFRESS